MSHGAVRPQCAVRVEEFEMKKLLWSLAIASTLVIVLDGLQSLAYAHGGNYRGPAGQVPPTGRTPSDPTPPPDTGGGGSGGGGGQPGTTPGLGGGVAGGGPAFGPRTGAGSGSGAGVRGGATTPNTRKKGGSKSEGFERWEFWWAYNREPFLNLKTNLAHRGPVSGSADWLLGKHDKEDASTSQRPTTKAIREKVLPVLQAALKDKHFDVRAAAVIALGKAGSKAQLPAIIETLGDSQQQVSESAALAIGILGEPAGLPVLRDLIKDTREGKQLVKQPQGVPFRTRAFAGLAMGLIGDPSAVPDLLEIANPNRREPNKDVPVCAIVGLGIMGSAAKDAVGPLIEIVTNARVDDFIRSYAATSLGKIGEPEATPIIRKLLRDGSLHVRRSALIALGRLGAADDAATIKYLQSEVEKGSDRQGRNWACISLGQIGGPVAMKTLKGVVDSETGSFQSFGALALAILAKNSGKQSEVVGMLRKGLVESKSASTKGAFCIALGIVGDRVVENELVNIMLGKNDENLRGYAAVALGMMQAKSAVPAIKKVVTERVKDPDLQRAAATALGIMADKDVVALLSDVINKAGTEYVQSSAALAMGYIGDYTAIESLTNLIQDKKNPDLARAHATVALGVVAEDDLLPVLHVIAIDNNYRAMVEAMQEVLTIT